LHTANIQSHVGTQLVTYNLWAMGILLYIIFSVLVCVCVCACVCVCVCVRVFVRVFLFTPFLSFRRSSRRKLRRGFRHPGFCQYFTYCLCCVHPEFAQIPSWLLLRLAIIIRQLGTSVGVLQLARAESGEK